ncbi:MAG: leucine--tRNA ligase [Phycisphaerales bacterium]|jgi:leucyl-tRNA synthetase|nr:leucine--tRNA ligase [Phycisphaerales bacterium]
MGDTHEVSEQAGVQPTESGPSHRYTSGLANDIEGRWQKAWAAAAAFRAINPGDEGFDAASRRFYCLDMFPYPSGKGLHVGHPIGYIGTDIVCRYRRMRGDNVLHPMGWDAFGLPAEQYAIDTGVHPRETTVKAIDTFRRQLQRFGFSYDWDREFATIDEDYYKWTQWIWLQAWSSWYDHRFERARPISELIDALETGEACLDHDGCLSWNTAAANPKAWVDFTKIEQRNIIDGHRLAYLGEETVNWCPKLGTVLANEEVIDGRSERGGHPVVRRPLRQWLFRITAFAERLLGSLDELNWPDSTRTAQANWIGRSEGADLRFPIVERSGEIEVFTSRPDTLLGVTFMVLAPEHPRVEQVLNDPPHDCDVSAIREYVESAKNRSNIDRMAEGKNKTGHPLGIHATHPATGEPIPIWVSDYVLAGYGHGAIMAVPGHDDRDHAFALKYGLPIVEVVKPAAETEDECWCGDGTAINSCCDQLDIDGLPTADAKAAVIHWAELGGHGSGRTSWRIKDWLFSRQRYWGEPFPIVQTEDGTHYPVSTQHLPVSLPDLDDYEPAVSENPQPLLGKVKAWVETTAGQAGVDPSLLPPDTPVRRETNTMPGWAGSCWYYIRYCDPTNDTDFVGEAAERYWLGSTDTSAGGVDLYVGGAEHAVMHLLYARFWHKLLHDLGHLSSDEPFRTLFHQGLLTSFAYKRGDGSLVPIDEVDEDRSIERASGEAVERIVAKMSKSLRNVVNPDDVIAEYGADTFRLYEMYMGPLDASKPWNTRDIIGVFRFLQRAWRLAVNEETGELSLLEAPIVDVERLLHRTIAKVGDDIERLAYNTAIAAMIEFVNLATQQGGLTADQLDCFARILCPFAPHIAEEFHAKLGREGLCSLAQWPDFDESMLVDESIELPVQVKGKVRGRISVPADAAEEDVIAAALADEHVAELLAGAAPRRVIVVPGKIVNVIP